METLHHLGSSTIVESTAVIPTVVEPPKCPDELILHFNCQWISNLRKKNGGGSIDDDDVAISVDTKVMTNEDYNYF